MTHQDPATALTVATDWHKASYSQGQQNGCVEVGTVPGLVGVRDTKLGTASPILAFAPASWTAFLTDIRTR
ncbi:DUF397 domain-containing protein [Amycolatopsis sp. NPDC059027]|uniref:DUF397 domain-containing protein n=1 Tax=unclassified Amycolatopsis TaxID=2618356 RepID=UPI00366F38F8